MIKKIIVLGVLVLICLGVFTACIDYGYEYHFNVVGENGSISITNGTGQPSPVSKLGGKNGHELKFTATPNDGYQVKEWTFNGEIVEGNKSNSFTAKVASYKESPVYITVEFEPIS